jgi:hypothetical protein
MAARARAPASWPIRVSWRVRVYNRKIYNKKRNGHISPAVLKSDVWTTFRPLLPLLTDPSWGRLDRWSERGLSANS